MYGIWVSFDKRVGTYRGVTSSQLGWHVNLAQLTHQHVTREKSLYSTTRHGVLLHIALSYQTIDQVRSFDNGHFLLHVAGKKNRLDHQRCSYRIESTGGTTLVWGNRTTLIVLPEQCPPLDRDQDPWFFRC